MTLADKIYQHHIGNDKLTDDELNKVINIFAAYANGCYPQMNMLNQPRHCSFEYVDHYGDKKVSMYLRFRDIINDETRFIDTGYVPESFFSSDSPEHAIEIFQLENKLREAFQNVLENRTITDDYKQRLNALLETVTNC